MYDPYASLWAGKIALGTHQLRRNWHSIASNRVFIWGKVVNANALACYWWLHTHERTINMTFGLKNCAEYALHNVRDCAARGTTCLRISGCSALHMARVCVCFAPCTGRSPPLWILVLKTTDITTQKHTPSMRANRCKTNKVTAWLCDTIPESATICHMMRNDCKKQDERAYT